MSGRALPTRFGRMLRRVLCAMAALTLIANATFAATAPEFNASLLRRGVADYNAGRLADAARQLQIAAFGLIETIDQFQLAQTYVALASDRLGRGAETRHALERILAAQRLQTRFASVPLPDDIRTAFMALASRLLTAEQVSLLNRSTGVSVPPVTRPASPAVAQPSTTPSTTTPTSTTKSTTPPITPPATQPATTTPVIPTPRPVPPPDTATVRPPAERVPSQTPPRQTTTTNPPAPVVPASTRPTTPATTTAGQRPGTGRVIEETVVPFTAPAATKPATTSQPARSPATRMAEAERAIGESRLNDARAIYRDLSSDPTVTRDQSLAIAEGSYQSREFPSVVRVLDRVAPLRGGEEHYRYYLAVSLYETGRYTRARQELALALPYIELTPSVMRYRVRIEAAIE